MGRFLIIIGVVMMVIGIGAAVYGTFSSVTQAFSNFGDTSQLDQYCNEGETPVHDTSSGYVPGVGNTTTTQVWCEDAQGNRRPIIEDFTQDLFGQISSGFSTSILYTVLIGGGVMFLIIGIMVSVMRRMNARPQMVNPYGMSNFYPSTPQTPMGGQPTYTQQPYGQQPYVQQSYAQPTYTPPAPQPPAAPPPAANAPQDLASKLRQLEEARNSGLISLAEYQETRQRILDEMKDLPS